MGGWWCYAARGGSVQRNSASAGLHWRLMVPRGRVRLLLQTIVRVILIHADSAYEDVAFIIRREETSKICMI